MLLKTFKGGVHPKEEKEKTSHLKIRKAKLPKRVIIPLSQHTGTPCEPLVSVGEEVKTGQRIGDSEKFISAPIHASISGKVAAIELRPHPDGRMVKSIVIDSDGKDTLHESVKPYPPFKTLSKNDIRKIVRAAGIVGLGGGAFPTHVKLDPPHDKVIEYVILNGAECEPYLTADHRMMLENPEDIVIGLKAIMKTTDGKKGIIAIESNKPDAIASMRKVIKDEENLSVFVVKTKYPQGYEKSLIYSTIKREVPSGGLPMDVGCAVSNVSTAAAISFAIKKGMPLIERVVTVCGSGVKEPANLLVRIGTPFADAINECGGTQGEIKKVINGGPMMGIAHWTVDVPVTKGVTGILVFSEKEHEEIELEPCIRCAKCVDVCPVDLLPTLLESYAEAGNIEQCKKLGVLDCMECGVCAYICPSKRNIVQNIKLAKETLSK